MSVYEDNILRLPPSPIHLESTKTMKGTVKHNYVKKRRSHHTRTTMSDCVKQNLHQKKTGTPRYVNWKKIVTQITHLKSVYIKAVCYLLM